MPSAAVLGPTFACFRLSSVPGLAPSGQALDGEVEDYQVGIVEIDRLDFGDAPEPPYRTALSSFGAHHAITANLFLGLGVDPEPDGQPTADASGDDVLDFSDDEDGVFFALPIVPGDPAAVTASAPGLLDAWIDFNADGDWDDLGEQIFVGVPLGPGPNPLAFPVPAGSTVGVTFSRFHVSTVGGLPYYGPAWDGEVEDYLVPIGDGIEVIADFGDAPDPTYPTLWSSNGARHAFSPHIFLGALIDVEHEGQPNATAMGDDLIFLADEDGVVFTCCLYPGGTAKLEVNASVDGYVNAWIDFNGDGDWLDPDEWIANGVPVLAGWSSVVYSVPGGAEVPQTFARVRFTSYSVALAPTGLGNDGEVEDDFIDGTPLFADGFESGDTTAWSSAVP